MRRVAVVSLMRRGAAAAIGLFVLLGAQRPASPAPAPDPPLPTGAPQQLSPYPRNASFTDPGAISDVALRRVAEGLGSITSIANSGDSRLFVTLRSGRIVVWNGTRALHKAFLDISDRISCCGERGLLSVAFHPSYASSGLLFVAYTDKSGNLSIARYKRSADKANRADPASGVVLVTIPFPSNADHYGGELQFGPDGYLYAGIGDGGSGKDGPDSAQRDDVLLGKILRLDVDTNASNTPYFAVPRSNPFASAPPPLDEIWAKGLRDPWRFSFDRSTGDLYIGDVGPGIRQEIDFQPRSSAGGENYGWKFKGASPAVTGDSRNLRRPILGYKRQFGECAVAGGYVYRGSGDPRLSGVYFYGDFCTGKIWGAGQLTNAVAPYVTTFGEDSSGEIYVGTATGVLYRMGSTYVSTAARATPPAPEEPAEDSSRDAPVFSFAAPEQSIAPPAPMLTFAPVFETAPSPPPPAFDDSQAIETQPPEEGQPPESPPPPDNPPAATPAPTTPAPTTPDRQAPQPVSPDRPTPRVVERPHG